MILTDTSVVIDFVRSGDKKLRKIIVQQPAAVCGITRAEILHGAHDSRHRQRLVRALDLFGQVSCSEAIWDRVGDNLADLRAAGLTVPFADAIIATVGIHYDIEVWARDRHFADIQKVLPQLKLFQEPP